MIYFKRLFFAESNRVVDSEKEIKEIVLCLMKHTHINIYVMNIFMYIGAGV